MNIDNNEMEMCAMALFKDGNGAEAIKLQDEFLAQVHAACPDHCSCPVACKFHGNCVDCVIIHRGHADHLPHCLHAMVNARLKALSALTEHSIKGK
jgi:hypothetical protein